MAYFTRVYGDAFAVPSDDPIVNSDRVRVYRIGDEAWIGESTHSIEHVCSVLCLADRVFTDAGYGWLTTDDGSASVRVNKHSVETIDVVDFDPGDDYYILCTNCQMVMVDERDASNV